MLVGVNWCVMRESDENQGCWGVYWVLVLLLAGVAGYLIFETEVGQAICGLIWIGGIVFAVIMFFNDCINGK